MLRLPTAFAKPPLWVINKKDDIAAVLVLAVIAALQAVTHSDFYAELERLNMDNHQH